jgi:polyribonucleotide nucleotidyltransferase
MIRGPGRREIGHGNLAERSLKNLVPEDFTYTIRITSDITESNGSSSMASVCGGCLALMDAGVPISAPVAGISVGLIAHEGGRIMLTDIIGDEDHFGDMDFKVAGSEKGVTGVQVDLKIHGLDPAFVKDILERARSARLRILDTMKQTLAAPRPELSPYAPVILTATIPVDKIGALIGPGGKNIRKIQEETATAISIEDDGTVQIAGDSTEAAEAGRQIVLDFVAEAEIGRIYDGTVTRLMSFGAFVRILPDTEGMVHISEICEERVESIEDKLNVGDAVRVRVIEIDDRGRVNLTMRKLDEEFDPSAHIKRSGPRSGGDRGDRGDRGGRARRHSDRSHGSRDRDSHDRQRRRPPRG